MSIFSTTDEFHPLNLSYLKNNYIDHILKKRMNLYICMHIDTNIISMTLIYLSYVEVNMEVYE